jgi:hypothetical protein
MLRILHLSSLLTTIASNILPLKNRTNLPLPAHMQEPKLLTPHQLCPKRIPVSQLFNTTEEDA